MGKLLKDAESLFSTERLIGLAKVIAILVVGLIVARILAGIVGRVFRRRSAQHAHVAQRLTFYVLVVSVVAVGLNRAGLSVGVLLGTAGVATVALGFAARTSMSNFISGLFLVGERPFVIGDLIKVGELVGEVVAIDLLSVKLCTLDNLFVRLPNDALIKGNIVNLSRHPIRRVDISFTVPHGADADELRRVLVGICAANLRCLDEPAPEVVAHAFGESGLTVLLWAWTAQELWFQTRTELQEGIVEACRARAIEIALPRRVLIMPPAARSSAAAEGAAG